MKTLGEDVRRNIQQRIADFWSSVEVLPCGSGMRAISREKNVVVRVRVEKEFLDMRPNEREIKFIWVGHAVRTVGQLTGEPTLNRGLQSTFIPRVQRVGQGSCGPFADWMRHIIPPSTYTGGGKSKANTSSQWDRRGDRLYYSGELGIH